MKLAFNILLFIISILLFIPLGVWGIIETLIALFYKKHFFKALNVFAEFILLLAIIVDTILNVFLKYPANRILQNNGYKFGNRKDTISYALGMNEKNKTLTKYGKKLYKFLNFLDKDHCKKAIL